VDDLLLAAKSEGVGLIAGIISFQDAPNLCDHKSPTSQTNRRTDGRHAIARPRFALKCIARKKIWKGETRPSLPGVHFRCAFSKGFKY